MKHAGQQDLFTLRSRERHCHTLAPAILTAFLIQVLNTTGMQTLYEWGPPLLGAPRLFVIHSPWLCIDHSSVQGHHKKAASLTFKEHGSQAKLT